jgi:hypothetical protein
LRGLNFDSIVFLPSTRVGFSWLFLPRVQHPDLLSSHGILVENSQQ